MIQSDTITCLTLHVVSCCQAQCLGLALVGPWTRPSCLSNSLHSLLAIDTSYLLPDQDCDAILIPTTLIQYSGIGLLGQSQTLLFDTWDHFLIQSNNLANNGLDCISFSVVERMSWVDNVKDKGMDES
jgi:hypothetical protein